MRTIITIFALLAVLLAGCVSTSPAPSPKWLPTPAATPAATPSQVVQRFRDVLRAEMVPTALFMIDDLNYGSPAAEQVRQRMTRLAEEMAKKTYDFKPVDEQVQDGCAAVIVRENFLRTGPGQYTAFFLVERDGMWKIAPEPTDYNRFLSLSPAQATTFRVLERWFQLRKADLKVEERTQ